MSSQLWNIYLKMFGCLQQHYHKKIPNLWSGRWILHHYSTYSHTTLLVMQYLPRHKLHCKAWVGCVECFLSFHGHKQVLGPKTSFFKAQAIFDHSIFSWVLQYPVIPGLDVDMLVLVNGFCPFFPGGITSCIDIILSSVRLFTYKCQNVSGDPVL
jgi:hypothetical protein